MTNADGKSKKWYDFLNTMKAEWLVLPQVAQPVADPRRRVGRDSGGTGELATEKLR